MESNLKNIKRQIETIGLVLESPEQYKKAHLSALFKIGEARIDRDFKELRSEGVQIRFRKKRGAYFVTVPAPDVIKKLILKYFGIINSGTPYDRATNVLTKHLGPAALVHLVTMQRAIEAKKIIRLSYQKEGEETRERRVTPLMVFQRQGYYRLLAKEADEIKQFHFTKIRSVVLTDSNAEAVSQQKISSIFENSLEAWLSPNKYFVRLRFNSEWSQYLIPTMLIENQVMTPLTNGEYLVELTVNRLEELAYWIVPRGEGVIVESPKELKEMVIQLESKTLNVYRS